MAGKSLQVLNPVTDGRISSALLALSSEAKELYLDKHVQEIQPNIEPLEFYRNWIAPNRPVIIKNGATHWPAFEKWNFEYLREQMGSENVTVAVTPNGYADAPLDSYFVMPEERCIKFNQFLDVLEHREKEPGIFYIQKQNSNLTDEFAKLWHDVKADIPWFSEALGKKPDAVNFWMGDERAVTSMHKDNYENIYCVVRGYKDFILHPPTDLPWIPYKMYPPAKFRMKTGGGYTLDPLPDSSQVPWICIDPLNPDLDSYPQYRNATPIRCKVMEGDALYLPSLWFHHVRQSHACVAVNYWYDMEFDLKYNYYKLMQNLTWNDIPEDL